MHYLFLSILLICNLSISSCNYSIPNFEKESKEELKLERLKVEIKKIKTRIAEKTSVYDSKYAFFMDARIMSGSYRFFIVDLTKDSIIEQAVVAHGVGSETGIEDSLQFSNVPGSLMTSLGVYSVGSKYNGNFGPAYKLNGLDKTNNKAFERYVVLHSYQCVPFEEQLTEICNSEGCVMLSNEFFPSLFKYLDGNKKKVLLDVYY